MPEDFDSRYALCRKIVLGVISRHKSIPVQEIDENQPIGDSFSVIGEEIAFLLGVNLPLCSKMSVSDLLQDIRNRICKQ